MLKDYNGPPYVSFEASIFSLSIHCMFCHTGLNFIKGIYRGLLNETAECVLRLQDPIEVPYAHV